MDMGGGRGADNWIKDRPIFLERLLRAPAHAAEHFQCRASRRIYRLAVQVAAQREGALPVGFLGALAMLDVADASTIVIAGGERQQKTLGTRPVCPSASSDHPDKRAVVRPGRGVGIHDCAQ